MNLKKTQLLLLLIFIGFGSMQAQESDVAGVNDKYRFGFQIFPNFSSLKTVNSATSRFYETEKLGGYTGFGFGAIMDFKFGRNYYFSTGLNIVTGGGKLNVTSTNDNNRDPLDLKSGDISYRMQYIEIPFDVKMNNYINSNLSAFAKIGLQAGFNIGKKAEYENIILYKDPTTSTSSNGYEKITGLSMAPAMFGMNLGAGLTYNINENLDGLFSLSFTNYFLPDITNPQKGMLYSEADATEIEFHDGKQRLNGFAVNLGLLF